MKTGKILILAAWLIGGCGRHHDPVPTSDLDTILNLKSGFSENYWQSTGVNMFSYWSQYVWALQQHNTRLTNDNNLILPDAEVIEYCSALARQRLDNENGFWRWTDHTITDPYMTRDDYLYSLRATSWLADRNETCRNLLDYMNQAMLNGNGLYLGTKNINWWGPATSLENYNENSYNFADALNSNLGYENNNFDVVQMEIPKDFWSPVHQMTIFSRAAARSGHFYYFWDSVAYLASYVPVCHGHNQSNQLLLTVAQSFARKYYRTWLSDKGYDYCAGQFAYADAATTFFCTAGDEQFCKMAAILEGLL